MRAAAGALVPEYAHFDHQGSAVAATDASGAVLWRERYSPWGTRLLKPAGNRGDTGYTGHLMDNTTELVYMQARYYDSQIGRFYSTDPIGYQDQLNLYAYVHNDPVNKVDPTGECTGSNIPGECAGGGRVSGAGGLVGGAEHAKHGTPQTTNGSNGSAHANASVALGEKIASDIGGADSVHYNQRMSTITGDSSAPKLQADAAVVKGDKIIPGEVPSGRQTAKSQIDKWAPYTGKTFTNQATGRSYTIAEPVASAPLGRALGILGALTIPTGILSGRIRTDSMEHFIGDSFGIDPSLYERPPCGGDCSI